MYKEIVESSYDELRSKYPKFESISREQKIIAMYNSNNLDTYSNNSDIVVYYDCTEPTKPLLIVERVADDEIESLESLNEFIKRAQADVPGYHVFYNIVEDKEYFDITIVKCNIYDSLGGNINEELGVTE